LKRTPKRYQDPVLWVWLEFFSPLRGTNSKTKHYLLSFSFGLNTLKGNIEAPAVDLLRLNTLRDTKTAFLTPKRSDKYPGPFYFGVPPGL